MNEKNEDVAHSPIGSKPAQNLGFRPIFEFATDAKEPQEFQKAHCVEDFNPLAILQFIEHSVDDLQTAPDDLAVLKNNLGASHHFPRQKKTPSNIASRRVRGRHGLRTTLYFASLD